jgi:hypothetical protein
VRRLNIPLLNENTFRKDNDENTLRKDNDENTLRKDNYENKCWCLLRTIFLGLD